VAPLTPGDPVSGDRGVTGDAQGRGRQTCRTELEPARIHVRGAVAARGIAVRRTDGEVTAARPPDDRHRVAGRRSGERSRARAVAGEAPGHALVRAGHRVDGEVARGGVALRAGRRGRNVIRRLARGRQQVRRESRRRDVTVAAITRGRVLRVERRVGSRISCGGGAAGDHPQVGRRLVTVAAPAHAGRGDRRVTRDGERRGRNVRGADLEAAATRGDVGSRVAARAVTVGGAEPDVIGRDREDREYGIGGNAECPGDVRAMAAQTPADPLVDSGD